MNWRGTTTRSGRIRHSNMATPASRYTPSPRASRGLDEREYPFHDWTAVMPAGTDRLSDPSFHLGLESPSDRNSDLEYSRVIRKVKAPHEQRTF